MNTFVVRPAADLIPHGLIGLAAEADAEGVRNLAVLLERWVDGSERYDRPGESILIAQSSSDVVVGVGGLSQCPHVDGALRVRRFYVSVEWRRRGVASRLARRLIDEGLRHADILTCNARASEAASPFWEAMGFEPVNVDGITHIRVQQRNRLNS